MVIQQNLLDEVFKWCLFDDEILGITCDNLSSEDIPKALKSYDSVLSIIKQNRSKGIRMTIGTLQQAFYSRGFSDDMIFERIKYAELSDKDLLLSALTNHIKRVRSIQAYEDFGELYQKSDKDQAVIQLVNNMQEIEAINLANTSIEFINPFTTLIESVDEISSDIEQDGVRAKLPLCIPPIDDVIGGVDVTDTVLFILPSGGGKSTTLKGIGASLSRRGFKGIHFQLEGNDMEVRLKYGTIFSGVNYQELVSGNIYSHKLKKPRYFLHDGEIITIEDSLELIKINDVKMQKLVDKNMSFNLDIVSYQTLGDTSLQGVDSKILEWIGIHGCNPDFILLDSLDLCHPGDGSKYSAEASGVKARIQASAQKIKNMSTIYKTRFITSIQTSDIPMEKWNDPNFVITRNHAMGDKNVANPFSYVFSFNRTIVERKKKIARIYFDKLRHAELHKPVVFVKTAFNQGRYVDVGGTLNDDIISKLNDPNYIPPVKEKVAEKEVNDEKKDD